MTALRHLHTLELARNRLTSLGPWGVPCGVSSPSLCCLDLSHNRLTSLTQLHHLPHLRELTVSDNELSSLEGLQVLLTGLCMVKVAVYQHTMRCTVLQIAIPDAANATSLVQNVALLLFHLIC